MSGIHQLNASQRNDILRYNCPPNSFGEPRWGNWPAIIPNLSRRVPKLIRPCQVGNAHWLHCWSQCSVQYYSKAFFFFHFCSYVHMNASTAIQKRALTGAFIHRQFDPMAGLPLVWMVPVVFELLSSSPSVWKLLSALLTSRWKLAVIKLSIPPPYVLHFNFPGRSTTLLYWSAMSDCTARLSGVRSASEFEQKFFSFSFTTTSTTILNW